ncbi:MAG: proton-conducting transporter membrane subunit [Actinomycetota bacterium]|nr:proton-conducting transporter membrane subunit [Actinomycetota bacterium]
MPRVVTWAIPAFAVVVPFLFAAIILFFGNRLEKLREWAAVFATLFAFFLCFLMLPGSLKGIIYKCHVLHMTPRIWLHFRADGLSLVFALTASLLWVLATVFSLGYMKGEHALTRYYGFLILCLAWTMGIGFAGNLLTLFIFYELLSVSSYPIIAHEETPEALAAGKKYIIYVLVGGTFILLGIVLTFYLANSQTLVKTGILSMKYGYNTLAILFATFVVGFGVKAAIMPLHGWVPDAHPAAPAPASALLSGVLVCAGCYGIMRVIYNVFGPQLLRRLGFGTILAYVAAATIVVASIIALDQDNLKRRLAYSTIGQMSYIVLGAILLTPSSLIGGMVHIANHGLMKATLFLCSGVIIKGVKKRNISQMQGIGYVLPITMACFAIVSLGMMGCPPLAGFISKWMLCVGGFEAGKPIFVVVLLISSLLCAAYLLPVVFTAFFARPREEMEAFEEAHTKGEETHVEERRIQFETRSVPWTMLLPIFVGTLCVVILGFGSMIHWLALPLSKVAVKFLLK